MTKQTAFSICYVFKEGRFINVSRDRNQIIENAEVFKYSFHSYKKNASFIFSLLAITVINTHFLFLSVDRAENSQVLENQTASIKAEDLWEEFSF